MVVDISEVKYSYKSGGGLLNVIDIAKWSMNEGERIAISGPSGCGKSTLLNVIAGLLVPDRGSIEICGERIDKLGEAARDRFRARHLGYVFQNFNLLQGFTALENVLLAGTFSGKKARTSLSAELLDRVGLSARMHHYPSRMSIGEQQRVAVARALVNEPNIVLADEPTGSLDPKNSEDVVKLLRETVAERGVSLILVSHEKEVVSAFDNEVRFLDINKAFESPGGSE